MPTARPAGFSLQGLSFCGFIVRLWNSVNDDDIVNRAAELAYYFLFALFPALIFISAMFGMFASTKTQANIELMLYLGKVIPPGAFGMVEAAFSSTTRASDSGKLLFGALVALWSATYGMSSAQNILNVVYRVRETRPYWRAKLVAMLLTLAIFVLVFSAMLLLLVGDYVMKIVANDWLTNGTILIAWGVIRLVAALFFLSLVFSLTYHWGPDRKGHKWRWISPGAVAGIAGWLGVSIGFRVYLHFFNNYAVLYGSFGTVIVLLTWFYVSGLMLLLGAEINATLECAAQEKQSASSA
ncbi:MAG: YihY/virulence factor BrkB family protein [Acidobacteriaceae bacterium]